MTATSRGGRIERTCKVCAASFFARRCEVNRGFGTTCSNKCSAVLAGRARAKQRGDQNGPNNVRYKHGLSRAREMITEYERRQRDRTPAPYTAKALVRYAVKFGWLKRHPCETCGQVNVHAHHDDYYEPLRVRWLCAKCHAAEHRRLKEAGVIVRHLPEELAGAKVQTTITLEKSA